MQNPISCATQGALLVSRSDLATVIVSGPDRATWLNALVTCEVPSLKPGSALSGLMLNKKGKVLSELWIIAASEHLVVGIDAASSAALLEHMDHHLVMEDAEIRLAEPPQSWMLAIGPKAAELAARAAGPDLAAPLAWFGYPAAAWLASSPEPLSLAGEPDVLSLSLAAFDAVRIDLGLQRFGVEFSEATYPEEAGLDAHAINFNKGCYLGQEVVVKMRSRGHPSRKTVRVTCAAELPPATPLSNAAGEATGSVLSSAPSRVLDGRTVAFASVRLPDSQPGSILRAERLECLVHPAGGVLV